VNTSVPRRVITKPDGTIDFGALTSGERMSYLDGWFHAATDSSPEPGAWRDRPRADVTAIACEVDGYLQRENSHLVMFNAGKLEHQMHQRGAL
jgi:hypothetical protein